MGVNVRRRADVGMAEKILHRFQITAAVIRQTRRRVPEEVEPMLAFLLLDPRLFNRVMEMPDAGRIAHRTTVLTAEDEIVRLPEGRPVVVASQKGSDERFQLQSRDAVFGFRLFKLVLIEAVV